MFIVISDLETASKNKKSKNKCLHSINTDNSTSDDRKVCLWCYHNKIRINSEVDFIFQSSSFYDNWITLTYCLSYGFPDTRLKINSYAGGSGLSCHVVQKNRDYLKNRPTYIIICHCLNANYLPFHNNLSFKKFWHLSIIRLSFSRRQDECQWGQQILWMHGFVNSY